MLIIFSGLILRILLAIYNVAYESLPGASEDALAFHYEAVRHMDWLNLKHPDNKYSEIVWLTGVGDETGGNVLISDSKELVGTIQDRYQYKTHDLRLYSVGWIYSAFLGHLYNIFGASHYFSSLLSCFVWFLSAIILRSTLLKCKIDNYKINLALLFYTFLFPTSIIYTSVTLREVYILFSINLVVLLFFILREQKNNFRIFLTLIIISFFLFVIAYLHRSNIFFVILFLISLTSYYIIGKLNSYFKIKKFNHTKKLIIILGILTIFILDQLGVMEKLFYHVKNYQMGHFHTISIFRASYFSIDEVASLKYTIFNFFHHISKGLIYYFIQPSIFQISNSKDIILALENFMRLIMIFYSINKIFRYPNNNTLFHVLFMLFIFSEIPYSQATVNWGTASRHHVQIMGLLIVLFLFPKKLNK